MRKLILSWAIASMASFATADALYIVSDTSNHELFSINPSTMAVTDIGSLGIDGGTFTFGDLAYDTANNTMYYSGGRNDENLYTVNLTTGAATLVGSDAEQDLFALGYDPATNTLYGGADNGDFGSMNLSNGSFNLIGNNGVYQEGLAYNLSTGQLYSNDGENAFTVDPSTGATTFVTSFGFENDNGFTYDSARNKYWMFTYNGNLVELDTSFNVLNTTGLGVGAGASISYVAGVPEPMSMAVLGFGVVALLRRRSRK